MIPLTKWRLWPSTEFKTQWRYYNLQFCSVSYVSGFPRVYIGMATRKEAGRHQPIIWPKFVKNCVKMKKIRRGERPKFYYVDPQQRLLKNFFLPFRMNQGRQH